MIWLQLLWLLMGVAQAEPQQVTQHKLNVSADYVGPDRVSGGFWALDVVIENQSAERRRLDLEAKPTYGNWRSSSSRQVTLEPGERVAIEWLLPAWLDYPGNVQLMVKEGGALQVNLHNLGPTDHSMDTELGFLVLDQDLRGAGYLEEWTADLWQVEGAGQVLQFEQMPEHWGAYTMVDVVVLPTDMGLPPRDKLEPLRAWVRMGGNLLISGPQARVLAAEVLPEASESRFERSLTEGWVAWGYGAGQVVFADADHWDDLAAFGYEPDYIAITSDLQSTGSEAWLPSYPYWEGPPLEPSIPGIGAIPAAPFSLLMILVAFVLGPVNMVGLRLLRRPQYLLVTTPVIALASTIALVGYGVSEQGLGAQAARETVAILDQRTHRVALFEMRQLYLGSSQGKGLRPSPGALHAPDSRDWDWSYVETIDKDGRLLAGDFLPVRVPVRQVVLDEQSSRLRLTVDGDEVQNGLDRQISSLIVRAADGRFFELDQPLQPGASATLTEIDPMMAELHREELLRTQLYMAPAAELQLVPGSYVARLERSPWAANDGLEIVEARGNHVLYGILEAE